GLKLDRNVTPTRSIDPRRGQRENRMIIVVLVMALGYFAFDKFALTRRREVALLGKSTETGAAASELIIDAKSISVLPFENLSESNENAFFAAGVQDQILSYLAQIADLKVISRTSVMQYRNATTRNIHEIAQQLGVAHVLEGTVQRVGDTV